MRAFLGVTAVTVAFAAIAGTAAAHVVRVVGPYSVEIGWETEPPLAGFENGVEVRVTETATDRPVLDLGPSAGVAVTFGDAQTVIPIQPTERPGQYRAQLVPTRPGTYELRLRATIDGREIDAGAACSQGTFECVLPASEAEFPVADPPLGQVADRASAALPRAEEAADAADAAKLIAIAAIIIAALALTLLIAVLARGRRKPG